MAGKNRTSRRLCWFVSIITNRSIPRPHPAVGGRPYSRAVQNVSSSICASSSPCVAASAWAMNLSLCTSGSFSSVYAFAISLPQTNSSNRSVSPACCLWCLARGDRTAGWSMMKLGFMHLFSSSLPTNLSNIRAGVFGGWHVTLYSSHSDERNDCASSDVYSLGKLRPVSLSSSGIIRILRKGGVKSISTVVVAAGAAAAAVVFCDAAALIIALSAFSLSASSSSLPPPIGMEQFIL
mmetsp:Transcript_29546/g.41192  ORF Transcript_29546/g.41192 Transcript_29546/m.41192 type:complete len:237 (-) Transcript_29546:173-883(-)